MNLIFFGLFPIQKFANLSKIFRSCLNLSGGWQVLSLLAKFSKFLYGDEFSAVSRRYWNGPQSTNNYSNIGRVDRFLDCQLVCPTHWQKVASGPDNQALFLPICNVRIQRDAIKQFISPSKWMKKLGDDEASDFFFSGAKPNLSPIADRPKQNWKLPVLLWG